VWAGGWTEEDCRAAVESTRDAGNDFIEVPLLDPSTVDVEMTRKHLESADLRASCLLGLSFETDISSEDTDVSARGERLLTDAARATAGIGASFLGGVLYSAMDKYHAPTSKASRERCVEVLTRVAGVAAKEGVTLGIEPVNRCESNICTRALRGTDSVRELRRAVISG
jgi:D-psicose/D-tagatose/L-ribulose 3-epimerase